METERVPGVHRQVLSHPCRGLQVRTQQCWIQMIREAMDTPNCFLHKAIPSHQPLRGRVLLSQHNTYRIVTMQPALFFDTLFFIMGQKTQVVSDGNYTLFFPSVSSPTKICFVNVLDYDLSESISLQVCAYIGYS